MAVASILGRIRGRAKRQALPTKNWKTAQNYELDHAIGFMQEQHFQSVFSDFKAGRLQASSGHTNDLMLREFFDGSPILWESFKSELSGKIGLDIGPCVISPLATWDFLSRSIAIEPLGEAIRKWQTSNLGSSPFDTMELYSSGADTFIPRLFAAVDGVIFCRNMLDHTPNWPFVLSNISAYAAKGCYFLFWTDINHNGTADEGHFDICSTSEEIKRLIQQLGFDVLREHESSDRIESNWGCVAKKIV